MPKFHSLRPVSPSRINDGAREPLPAFHTTTTEKAQDTFNQEIELPLASVAPVSSGEQHLQAEPISSKHSVQAATPGITTPRIPTIPLRYIAPQTNTEKALQPLQSARAVESYQPQSLATALQMTMEPKTNRLPIIIPAEMKRKKRQPVTETLSPVTRRTISRFKMGIVSGAIIAFTILTILSFRLTNQGNHTFALFEYPNLLQSQQGSNSALSQASIPNTQSAATDPGMPNIPQTDLVALAQQDAIKYGISPVYFVRQIYAESGFNPNAYSPAGAVGIAQFEPSTAAALGIDPYDPVSALDGAAKYMARLSASFGGDYAKALAAYNAGSGAVNNAVSAGGANWLAYMPLETQNYVNKIMYG